MHRPVLRLAALAAAALLALHAPSAAQEEEVDLADQIVGARTWTHSNGRQAKAGLESATATTAVLRLMDGRLLKIKLADFSEEDRAYSSAWLENNAAPAGFGEPEQTVGITAVKGTMKYDKSSFSVYPGKRIKLVLRNADDMHHNIVVCTRATKDKGLAVAQEAWQLGADGFSKHWIPEHEGVLFASKMADPHSTATLYFTAPTKQGKYPYVCTLPGHALIMNGTMVVTKEINPLSELTFAMYKGSWEKLPDWDRLEPEAEGPVESGKIDLDCTKERDNFGLVFKGKIEAPADGDYAFTLGSDDGSRLLIDGRVVIDHDGVHGFGSKAGEARLGKGLHDIEVQFFERSGEESLYLGWKPPGEKKEFALSTGGNRPSGPTGQLLVAEEEARIYRNFIQGAGPRAIGVGYPGGLNLAYDANNMRIALLWLGEFIDAARHWNGRGQGFQPPAGEAVLAGPPGVPFGVLDRPSEEWPEEFLRADNKMEPEVEGGFSFKGYRLGGSARIPSFRYTFAGLLIEDSPVPQGSSDAPSPSFVRTLKLSGEPVANLYFRAAAGDIERKGDGVFTVDDEWEVQIKAAARPVLRDLRGKKELLVPVRFTGGTATIEQTITWL